MPKLIVSIDGVTVKEVQLTKDRSTIGRRPYNDIVIDHLAVSGEHAVVLLQAGSVLIEDLGSTNGTYVNGKTVKKQPLMSDDVIEVGKYKLKFVDGQTASMPAALDSSLTGTSSAPSTTGSMPMGIETSPQPEAEIKQTGPRVKVLTGAAAGREMELTKVVTTIGKPGVSVASITKKAHGFDLVHVEGENIATVNGVTADNGSITLKNHDHIALGNIRLEFIDL